MGYYCCENGNTKEWDFDECGTLIKNLTTFKLSWKWKYGNYNHTISDRILEIIMFECDGDYTRLSEELNYLVAEKFEALVQRRKRRDEEERLRRQAFHNEVIEQIKSCVSVGEKFTCADIQNRLISKGITPYTRQMYSSHLMTDKSFERIYESYNMPTIEVKLKNGRISRQGLNDNRRNKKCFQRLI